MTFDSRIYGAGPQPHPGHAITVTVTGNGPFGRAWVDCSCGFSKTCASKRDANRTALAHHHAVGGCNCPPNVVASDVHPKNSGLAQPGPVAAATSA